MRPRGSTSSARADLVSTIAQEALLRVAAGIDGKPLGPAGPPVEVREDFRAFLPFWLFVQREGGGVQSLAALWPGQERAVEAFLEHPAVVLLKSGKTGLTELECCWDAWRLLFGPSFSRVHLFSQDADSAGDLLKIVRFGIQHLPASWGFAVLSDEPGGDTRTTLKVSAPWSGVAGDVRTLVSYAAKPHASIAQSCVHAHVDELGHQPFAASVWGSVKSTIAPGGTVHVVSRGAGPDVYLAELWEAALQPGSGLFPLFIPYDQRPGRDRAWYETQAMTMPLTALRHFAPETPEDALAGADSESFVDMGAWDALPSAPVLRTVREGDDTPVVVALDAGIVSDNFAMVAVSRRPERHDDVAVRYARAWVPSGGRRLDLVAIAAEIRAWVGEHNVVQVCYDPYALQLMADEFVEGAVAWMAPFEQGVERLKADAALRQLITARRLAVTPGLSELREHVGNAGIKLGAEEGTLRLVKRSPGRKIDLCVALSMGCRRVRWLNL